MAQEPGVFDPLVRVIAGMITDPTYCPDYISLIKEFAETQSTPKDLVSEINAGDKGAKDDLKMIAKFRDALLAGLLMRHHHRKDKAESPLPLISSGTERFFSSSRARDWLQHAAIAAQSQDNKCAHFDALLYIEHSRDHFPNGGGIPRHHGLVRFSVTLVDNDDAHVEISSIQFFESFSTYSNSIYNMFKDRVVEHCRSLCESMTGECNAQRAPQAFKFITGEEAGNVPVSTEPLQGNGEAWPAMEWASIIAMGEWVGNMKLVGNVKWVGNVKFPLLPEGEDVDKEPYVQAAKNLFTSLLAEISWPVIKSTLEDAEKCARESFKAEVAVCDSEAEDGSSYYWK